MKNELKNIQEISDSKQCYGCGLCLDICPVSAINFAEDSEGFLFPQVNKSSCNSCKLCLTKCPVKNEPQVTNYEQPKIFAAWHKDKAIVAKSTSGGIFPALAEYILQHKGVVYGAKFDNNMTLKHEKACDINEIDKLKGSKYLQSNLQGIFKNIQKELSNEKKILFVGLPCQVAAVKNFFGENKDLLLVDLICHGVNSPGVFNTYTNYLEKKYSSKIKDFRFREKSFSWLAPEVKVILENGKEIQKAADLDSFYAGFRKNIFLRECCYSCKYTKKQRYGDITIGDFWGVPEVFLNKNGTSLVFLNNQKGDSVFKAIIKKIVSYQSDFATASKKNPQLSQPSKITHQNRSRRAIFFSKLHKGLHKELFETFVFGQPFPRLRKFRYYLIHLTKFIKHYFNE